jgi:hypothetical protein
MEDGQRAELYTSVIDAIQGLIGGFSNARLQEAPASQRSCRAVPDNQVVEQSDIDEFEG